MFINFPFVFISLTTKTPCENKNVSIPSEIPLIILNFLFAQKYESEFSILFSNMTDIEQVLVVPCLYSTFTFPDTMLFFISSMCFPVRQAFQCMICIFSFFDLKV